MTDLAQLQVAMDYTQTASIAFIKLSALFFYRRVLCVSGISNWFDIATKISIAIIILWLVVFEFLAGFQCGTHLDALWDGTYLQYCTISFPWLYGLTVSDVLLDVWILALPIPLVCNQNVKFHWLTNSRLCACIRLGRKGFPFWVSSCWPSCKHTLISRPTSINL